MRSFMLGLLSIIMMLVCSCTISTGRFEMDKTVPPELVKEHNEFVPCGKWLTEITIPSFYLVYGRFEYMDDEGQLFLGRSRYAVASLDSGVWYLHQQGQYMIEGVFRY